MWSRKAPFCSSLIRLPIRSNSTKVRLKWQKLGLDSELATTELTRAQTLQKTDAGTVENVDQRSAEQRSAQAALDEAEALVRDAKFDLDRTRVYAPFTGRMGTHLVSVGNLVSGNRGGGSSTTLLATVVSIDPSI